MKKYLSEVPGLLKDAIRETIKVQYQNLAASLAYYQFLSFAPLVGFILFTSNKLLGSEKTASNVRPFLENYFSPQFVEVIIFFLQRKHNLQTGSLITLSILAGLALAYSTKEYFGMIKDAIELVWNKRGDKFGIWELFKRIKEDLKVAVGGLCIVIVFAILGAILPRDIMIEPESSNLTLQIVNYISTFIFEFLFYSTIMFYYFKFLPPVKIEWKNVIIPSIAGGIFQVIGREILKIHMLNNPEVNLAESLLVVLFWFYYSNMVLIYSAEFSKVYISSRQNINYMNLKFDS